MMQRRTKHLVAVITGLVVMAVASPALARHKHHGKHGFRVQHQRTVSRTVQTVSYGQQSGGDYSTPSFADNMAPRSMGVGQVRFISHPSGCPARAFCGCGASVDLFGHPVRDLYLAANWIRKFPRALAARNMVAARSHHVFVLKEHVQGTMWLVADYNSGGHASRLHIRDVSGYAIVNPHT